MNCSDVETSQGISHFETQQLNMPQTQYRSLQFSVIVPAKNEENHIARCLGSLRSLQFDPKLFEVILVDNGSTDRTKEIVAAFSTPFSLRVLERKNVYISAVRNWGASFSQGEYFAFLDADCEVRSDWLQQAARSISTGTTGIFGSFYQVPEGSSWIARQWYGERERKQAGEVSFLPSGNLFVSREIFRNVQGFDESIQTNEDFELCQRIRAAGFTITNIPKLGVIHWGTPQTLGGFFRKNRWHGMHVFRVFLRSLPELHNVKAIALAIYTLSCLAGQVAGVAAAIAWRSPWPLFAFSLAVLMPPLFLGIRAAISSRKMSVALPIALLSLIYATARASCLLDWRNWMVRKASMLIGEQ
jgi:glycosyltransferase involved in cell wall biosynthesis